MAEEIERKFIVSEAGDLDQHASTRIEQGYLAIGSGDDAEVRIRRADHTFTLTVKGGYGEVRTEEEIEIGADRFESLSSLTGDRRVAKTRYRVPHGELVIAVDVYGGALDGLITAEVEFESEAEAADFDPPDWIGTEVTGDDRYGNASLATRGLPERT